MILVQSSCPSSRASCDDMTFLRQELKHFIYKLQTSQQIIDSDKLIRFFCKMCRNGLRHDAKFLIPILFSDMRKYSLSKNRGQTKLWNMGSGAPATSIRNGAELPLYFGFPSLVTNWRSCTFFGKQTWQERAIKIFFATKHFQDLENI